MVIEQAERFGLGFRSSTARTGRAWSSTELLRTGYKQAGRCGTPSEFGRWLNRAMASTLLRMDMRLRGRESFSAPAVGRAWPAARQPVARHGVLEQSSS